MTFLLLVALVINVRGQDFQLTMPDKIDFYYKTYTIDTLNIDAGGSGSNVIWDFSKARITDEKEDISHYGSSENNPFSALFPTANLLENSASGTHFMFLRKEKNCLLEVGSVDIEDSIVKHVLKGGSDTLLSFPIYLGKKWSYTATKSEENNTSSANGLKAYQLINAQFEVDGEGTIILPNGKQYKALRLNTTVDFDGYAYYTDPKDYKYNKKTRRQRYQWYIQEMPLQEVFFIEKTTINQYNKNQRLYYTNSKMKNIFIEYLDNHPTSFGENNINLRVLDNEINFNYAKQNETTIKIFSSEGKVVKQIKLSSEETQAGMNSINFNLETFPTGLYIIALISKEGNSMYKWLKK